MTLSDYDEQRRAARRAINAQNKRRAKTMEARVMRYLQGNRVPMSGSGSIKGDGQILSDKGYILVECKMSAALQGGLHPCILIPFKWFDELKKDSKSMRASMGVLVFHYHNTRADYLIISKTLFEYFFHEVVCLPEVDRSTKNSWRIRKDLLDVLLTNENNMIQLLARNEEIYLIMPIEVFRNLLWGEGQ